ncbi:MAG: formate C-acetyltransferase/glycerol dehydratase family glycyl radical enzyme, partial [Olegusella sp.]|nr:formate C-acetyltransferase/glycerol dehydratase family glycyl radical enzyme [Olegusella sp.]
MDIKEFAKGLSEATKEMSDEERATVKQMFEKVSDQLDKPICSTPVSEKDTNKSYEVPEGPTARQVRLKDNFINQTPSITTYRARAVTEVMEENPGMPRIELRAKAFRHC